MTAFSQTVQIALIYTSIELACVILIIKIKNPTCACLIVLRAFIYASNEAWCGTLIINLRSNSACACYCKQIKHPLQESNKNTKYVLKA